MVIELNSATYDSTWIVLMNLGLFVGGLCAAAYNILTTLRPDLASPLQLWVGITAAVVFFVLFSTIVLWLKRRKRRADSARFSVSTISTITSLSGNPIATERTKSLRTRAVSATTVGFAAIEIHFPTATVTIRGESSYWAESVPNGYHVDWQCSDQDLRRLAQTFRLKETFANRSPLSPLQR